MHEIRRSDGEVLAEMRLPESLASESLDTDFHPALLDACFHVVGAALPGGGSVLADAFLLMNVQRLRVLAPLPATRIWAHVHVDAADRADLATRETFRADLHLHGEDGRVLMALTGIAFKRARPGALRAPRLPERVQAMLHEVTWREVPDGMRLGAEALAADFESQLPALAERHRFDRYAEFLPGLDRLASSYVRRALGALGAPLQAGGVLTRESRAALGVLERHQRLFERMLDIGAEDGWLRREGTGAGETWHVEPAAAALEADPSTEPETMGAALAAAHADAAAELALTQRCGRELAAVMRGRADPLALLFPGGSLADTERLYRDSPPAQAYNGLIARVVERLAAQADLRERPLRVLEIGAGTGSTTAYVLPLLAGQLAGRALQYTFTDVSPLFLHRARERFAANASESVSLRYQLLDIGLPPQAQGFESAGYDIVIGANVLHATADLLVTLGHVRALLAPGGSLVLLEGVLPQRFGDLTVGLLDGWWAFSDTKRRNYALMPRPQWLNLLSECGFIEAAALPGETAHPVWKQQAIFIAQVAHDRVDAVPRAPTRWLVMPDRGGIAEAVAGAMRARGDAAILLDGEAVRRSAPTALSQALAAAGAPAPAGLLDLAALDLRDDATQDTAALMGAQERVLGGTLALVQALAMSTAPLPLTIVTRGAQAVRAGEGANATQATVWGLSHVVAIEHPELACRRIDLDPNVSADAAAAMLLAELDAPRGEDQIARRAAAAASPAGRLVRRLRPAPRSAGNAGSGLTTLTPRADRSYLVTGGLHGLGLRVARWLVQRGARHLVLMGRRGADAPALQEIDSLRRAGAEVDVHPGDVADEAGMQALLHRLRQAPAALAGVVHAAGALDDGVVSTLTWPRFETVMAAKVRGSWNLHRHAGALDFLVFFSSGASVGGSAGQANHAAANAFEDALAWHRNTSGQPTLSINWGPWAEIGAAADRHLKQPGALQPIAPSDGIAALEHLMRVDVDGRFQPAQTAVFATDWAHLRPVREAGTEPTLYRDLKLATAPPRATSATAGASSPTVASAAAPTREPDWRERLSAALPNRRRALLRDLVRGLGARVLGLARADELSPDEPLRQLGLDSLMAVELRNLLSKAVGQTLPATVTFDHPTVAALVDHLGSTIYAEELAKALAAASPAAPSALAMTPASTADAASPDGSPEHELDADALAAQLMNRLDRLGEINEGETS